MVEADIVALFDSADRTALLEMLRERVPDGSLLRLVDKSLRAGVMEVLWTAEKLSIAGTPNLSTDLGVSRSASPFPRRAGWWKSPRPDLARASGAKSPGATRQPCFGAMAREVSA